MKYLPIVFSSAVVYLFIVIALRLFGKKEIAQLSVVDLVFVLLISNAVQNAMVGPDTSLFGGLIAASTLFVINFLFKFILYKFPKFSNIVQGQELILINNGQINYQNLQKVRLGIDELNEAIREHGVKDARDVDLAILEMDGSISILSHDFSISSQKTSKKHKIRPRITKNNG